MMYLYNRAGGESVTVFSPGMIVRKTHTRTKVPAPGQYGEREIWVDGPFLIREGETVDRWDWLFTRDNVDVIDCETGEVLA